MISSTSTRFQNVPFCSLGHPSSLHLLWHPSLLGMRNPSICGDDQVALFALFTPHCPIRPITEWCVIIHFGNQTSPSSSWLFPTVCFQIYCSESAMCYYSLSFQMQTIKHHSRQSRHANNHTSRSRNIITMEYVKCFGMFSQVIKLKMKIYRSPPDPDF